MQDTITTRPIYKSDFPQVIKILQLNIPKYFASEEEEDFLCYIKNESENYFVLEKNKIILGAGGYNYLKNYSEARISWDFFHPNSHGKGYGTVLTKFRIEKIKREGLVNRITVRTSQLAYGFYGKLGFELKEIEKDYWAEGFHLYRMQLKL